MIDDRTKAAMAYLDEAHPCDGSWTYGDAREWLEGGSREARGLCAALDALGIR